MKRHKKDCSPDKKRTQSETSGVSTNSTKVQKTETYAQQLSDSSETEDVFLSPTKRRKIEIPKETPDYSEPDGEFKGSIQQQETFNDSIHQQEIINGSIHQQETFNGSIHQQETFNGSIHQQEPFNGSIHQQETFNGSIHQQEPFNDSIHQEPFNGSIHRQETESSEEQFKNLEAEDRKSSSLKRQKTEITEEQIANDLEADLSSAVKRRKTQSSEESPDEGCGRTRWQWRQATESSSTEQENDDCIPNGRGEDDNDGMKMNGDDEEGGNENDRGGGVRTGPEGEDRDTEHGGLKGAASDTESAQDGHESSEDDNDTETKFTDLFFSICGLVSRMSGSIEQGKVDDLRRQLKLLRQMSGQDRSFQFYISRPYRWPQTLGQMRRHPRAQLAIDYVTGRVPVGSRYQWPHEVYREGWRPYRPQEKYCSSLMHLATLCNDHRLGGVGPAHVLLSTGSCVPSLFWTDSLGLCPLHWAVLRGDVTLLVYLLHAMRKVWTVYGDQPLQQDNAVQTAASLADRLPTRKQTFAEILQMAFELNLRLVGDSGVLYTLLVDSLQWVNLSVEDFSLCDAVHINFPNLVSRLLSDGCPVHCSSPQPFDPLHCAVVSLDDDFQDQLRIIQLLLQHGADPNRIGYIRATGVVVDNGTPLHFVLGSVCNLRSLPFRSHQMAQLLLEYGADPHRVNTDSQTCYHLLDTALKRHFFALVEQVRSTANRRRT